MNPPLLLVVHHKLIGMMLHIRMIGQIFAFVAVEIRVALTLVSILVLLA